MANRFPKEREETGHMRSRKGHDMTWSCDIYGEPIRFYCKDHKTPICHPCATKDHQRPCHLENIEDVIFQTKRKVENTQTKIAAAKKRMKTVRSKLESSETSSSNHLQSVNDRVNATYNGKLKSVKDKERDEIRLINEEADEEIRIINEKRERRIKACKEETENQQQIYKDSQAKLLSEIKKIEMTVRKVTEDLKSKNQHEINIMDNLDSKIERIKVSDKTLVNEAPQVIASLDESLSSNVHQEVADYLDRIEREVQRVKFVEGEVGGEYYQRIDGYIGKWEPVKSIDITSIVNEPLVRGLISDDEICVLEINGNILCVTHISTEHTEKVNDGGSFVTSCAPVDSNARVCGKESFDRYITLYDRQWSVIRDITIPQNTPVCTMYVDVDRDGMIIAGEECHSNIYVINPADGKIVSTITMKGKVVWGMIRALSSGDVVVQTKDEFIVISRSGEEKAFIHCDEWKDPRYYTDKLTDTLYITYEDTERKVYAVDQVSCDGNIRARRIVEYKQLYCLNSPCLVTPSGNLVGCDGEKLLVYKKSFVL